MFATTKTQLNHYRYAATARQQLPKGSGRKYFKLCLVCIKKLNLNSNFRIKTLQQLKQRLLGMGMLQWLVHSIFVVFKGILYFHVQCV